MRLYLPSLAANSTAAGANGGGRLSLLVFYHGGAFVTSSAFSPAYHRYLNALAWAALRWTLASARRSPEPRADPWLSRLADPAQPFLTGAAARQHRAQHSDAHGMGGPGRRGVRTGAQMGTDVWSLAPRVLFF